MRGKLQLMLGSLSLFALSGSGFGAVIASEDFDGGATNLTGTANVNTYGGSPSGGSAGDVFGIVNSTSGAPFDVADDSVVAWSGGVVQGTGESLGIAGQNTSTFFAVNDADASNVGGLNNATWTFDISSALQLFGIDMDIAAMGDFESSSSDGFTIDARIDGGTYSTIFQGITNEDEFHTYRAFDNAGATPFGDDDPLEIFIDGSSTAAGTLDKSIASTGEFDTWSSTFGNGLSGSTLDIRLSWAGSPSGSEPMGFDNIVINGQVVPEPSRAVLILAGLSALFLRRRR